MTDTTHDWWEREQVRRHRLLRHVKTHLGADQVETAVNGYRELLEDAHEEMVEEMLLPIFNWSDWWPKRLAAEMLGLPTDEYDWEELVDAFEAREGQAAPSSPSTRKGCDHAVMPPGMSFRQSRSTSHGDDSEKWLWWLQHLLQPSGGANVMQSSGSQVQAHKRNGMWNIRRPA